jgi:hypothetical protein
MVVALVRIVGLAANFNRWNRATFLRLIGTPPLWLRDNVAL